MKRVNFALAAIILFNIAILFMVFKINKAEHQHKINESISHSTNYELTHIRELEQQYAHLSQQIQDLSLQFKNIQTNLSDNKSSRSSQAKTTKPNNQSPEELALIEKADEDGFIAVDMVLVSGTLGQDGALSLRQVMSNMSPEAHHKALQKLIIAINNGNLVMQPGALL